MLLSRVLLLLITAANLSTVQAQQPVRLVDPAAIMTGAGMAQGTQAHAGMQAAGLAEETMARIMRLSVPMGWPEGWRSDSARNANRDIFPNATAYRICDLIIEDEPMSIVHIPAFENYHMPEGVRGSEDMYMMVMAAGLGDPPPAPKPKASKGPNWRNMPRARITRPDLVYATYDLSSDPAAITTLEKRGLSKTEIDAVIFRSHERNWPEGMDALDKRRLNRRQFKKYNAYVAARWENKVLLVIPAETNKKQPYGVRPYMDIYMIYTGPAVAVMKK